MVFQGKCAENDESQKQIYDDDLMGSLEDEQMSRLLSHLSHYAGLGD